MTMDEREQKLLGMLGDKNLKTKEIINYVKKNCEDVHFGPKTLGMLFERIAGVGDNTYNNTFPYSLSIDKLEKIHRDFRSINGCQWARSDSGYLGNKYVIERIKEGHRVSTIKLVGLKDMDSSHYCHTEKKELHER